MLVALVYHVVQFIVFAEALKSRLEPWAIFRCLLCQETAVLRAGLCEPCLRTLPDLGEHCTICAGAVPAGARVCGACLAQTPPFNRVIAAYPYTFPIDWLVRRIKYAGNYTYAHSLAGLLVRQIEERQLTDELPECLVPVPLHDVRMRQRGFNQALELARVLARYFDIDLDWRCVKKIKQSQPQMALSWYRRRQSPRGSFQLNYPVSARHIAIVDDVLTTGATVSAVAQLLRRTPLQRIDVWVMARTQINVK